MFYGEQTDISWDVGVGEIYNSLWLLFRSSWGTWNESSNDYFERIALTKKATLKVQYLSFIFSVQGSTEWRQIVKDVYVLGNLQLGYKITK